MFLKDRDEYRKHIRNRACLLAGALVLAVDTMPLQQIDAVQRVHARSDAGEDAAPARSDSVSGGLPLYLEPPPDLPIETGSAGESQRGATPAAFGVPASALAAYQRASAAMTRTDPGCGMSWPVLAGIGRVESNHARHGNVTLSGDMRTPIYGPELNGRGGNMAIRAGNGWARAAGPMQFIPSTWQKWGADGSGDGRKDPQNVYDATLAAGRYLCAGDITLSTQDGVRSAVLRYNHSDEYANTVMDWISAYERGGWPAQDQVSSESGTSSPEFLADGPPPAPPAPEIVAPPPPPAAEPPVPEPPPAGPPPPGECTGCGPIPGLAPVLKPVVTGVGGTVGTITDPIRYPPPIPIPLPQMPKPKSIP